MTTNGGKREGAGRPKGAKGKATIQSEIFREALFNAVMREQKPLLDSLIKEGKDGNPIILKEILERILGKVKEHMKIESESFDELAEAIKQIAQK